ncbi:XRE family transcriptional regulator [Photobacterium jeanii]|uniref:XRE family transcriptional regulator n=1 Tax=Photobacterium jeanii TaxID=858640 RepID=A0A178K2C7_9GAMM|nr:2TM domain-containing protein [Photobacterium jeanii]OAN11479.1 XRE family transcriptional regulator [Photobacterium jeanii]PST90998.1 helix-turn-helix domain-containing protein [Photobacterium jeanii]
MIVRKLRLQRGWSQEQLSQMSGLSIRTIQRIERGQKAGLESLKSLAAVFEVQVSDLQKEPEMNNEQDIKLTQDEQEALDYVRGIKGFYSHLLTYVLVIGMLFAINLFTSPDDIWAWWPAMGWGIGLAIQALNTFDLVNFFNADWEKKQVEKRLGRKL